MQKDLREMTGEAAYGRGLTYNSVSLDGNNGHFMLLDKTGGKNAEGKYEKVELGKGAEVEYDAKTGKPTVKGVSSLEVVFLKVRRTLSYYHPTAGMQTSEHTHKNERVMLYKPGQRESGIAADLREQYPDLKTQQIVYAYFPARDEIVRLVVKGSSLGSKAETPGIVKFYDYLQSFKGDEHFYQFLTKLTPVEEDGPKGLYFALSFERGRELDEEEKAKAVAMIEEVHALTEAQDQRLRERFAREALEPQGEVEKEEDEERSGPEYPDEEVNPDDIPF